MDNIKLNETEIGLLKLATQDAMEADRRAKEAIVLVMRLHNVEGVYALSKDCTELVKTDAQSQ